MSMLEIGLMIPQLFKESFPEIKLYSTTGKHIFEIRDSSGWVSESHIMYLVAVKDGNYYRHGIEFPKLVSMSVDEIRNKLVQGYMEFVKYLNDPIALEKAAKEAEEGSKLRFTSERVKESHGM